MNAKKLVLVVLLIGFVLMGSYTPVSAHQDYDQRERAVDSRR